jgi:hypothetical protein
MTAGVRWLAQAPWYFSVTFVRDIAPEELGIRLGADPAVAPVAATAREAESLLIDPNVGIAQLGEANGWAFAVEYGEAGGTRHSVLAQLSRGGCHAVNLDPQVSHPPPMFSYAADGELLCSFGLAEEARRWGSQPDLLDPAMRSAGVVLPDGSSLKVGAARHAQRVAMPLGVIEKHFGLSLPRQLLDDELPTVGVSGRPT